MKKTLSFLLAILMIVGVLPLMGLVVGAEGEPSPTTRYVVYEEDFDDLPTTAGKAQILEALGWRVPEAKVSTDIADYTVVVQSQIGAQKDQALCVSTLAPTGMNFDSFVTVFGSDAMALVKNGDFTLSYELTYRRGTTNTDGYSALIYNYNGKDGASISEAGGEAYGLVAVRVCGTGMNTLYYPTGLVSTMMTLENLTNTAANVMSNRYTVSGAYPSLYARLVDGAVENEGDTRRGTDVMIDVPLNISIQYSYTQGVTVRINGIVVSETNTTANYSDTHNTALWDDFVTRNDGSDIALMTKYGVVAEIDDIKIETGNVAGATREQSMPELLITEISPAPRSEYSWAEYIEIHNPTNQAVNLMDYSISVADNKLDGTVNNAVQGTRMTKFSRSVSFASLFGQSLQSTSLYYVPYTTVRSMPAGSYRYEKDDPNLRYKKVGANYVQDPSGTYCHIYYVEKWNTRYHTNQTDPTASYATNTWLAPGDTMLVYFLQNGKQEAWTCGVNQGSTSLSMRTGNSFMRYASWYGATTDTKIVAVSAFNLYDNAQQLYAICKTKDAGGNDIKWTNRYANDLSDVVCCVDYNSSLVAGIQYEGANAANGQFGQGGIYEANYSANYVYGVDASRDFRYGTLYTSRSQINKSGTEYRHVGKLAGYQEILISEFYCNSGNALPELMITEITPRTLTLAGTDYNAFSAIEVTNTSNTTLDLYRYALVRTDTGVECTLGEGFTRVGELKRGNPVTRGEANGAYYYFIGDRISNPETCLIEPGESAVIWLLTNDTYTAYIGDDDFGTDYFRQYWVNNGCPELGYKDAKGGYDIPVLAMDANTSTTFNLDNADRVFEISNESAIYGVAIASERVLSGRIPMRDVFSVAYLGYVSSYYKVTPQVVKDGSDYLVNVLTYSKFPVNASMHYVAGIFCTNRISAMADSLKVQRYNYDTSYKNSYTEFEEGVTRLRLVLTTNVALTTPRLGSLSGKEVAAVREHLFTPVTDGANTTYYYYDLARVNVSTLQGAAVSMSGWQALRFDHAIRSDLYYALVNTYGVANVKVGMLVTESARISGMTEVTRKTLSDAAIAFEDIAVAHLYDAAGCAVFGGYKDVTNAVATSFTAIGYLEVTVNGVTHTFWSGTRTAATAREIAEKAYEDFKTEEDDLYTNWCEGPDVNTSYYSPYDYAQRESLKSYL